MELMQFAIPLALVVVVLANNLLGSADAIVNGSFDKLKAKRGLFKGIIVALSGCMLYGAGILTPEISIGMFNEQVMTLAQGLNMVITGGFIYYALQDLSKIKDLVGAKVEIKDIPKEVDELSSNQRGS